MRLADYLRAMGIHQEDFARKIRVSQASVSRLVAGDQFPRPDLMLRIERATKGKVTATDFFMAHKAQGRGR